MVGLRLNQREIARLVEKYPPYLSIEDVQRKVEEEVTKQFTDDLGYSMKIYGIPDRFLGGIKTNFKITSSAGEIDGHKVLQVRLVIQSLTGTAVNDLSNPLKYQDRFID